MASASAAWTVWLARASVARRAAARAYQIAESMEQSVQMAVTPLRDERASGRVEAGAARRVVRGGWDR